MAPVLRPVRPTDQGSVAVEAAIIVPVLIVLVLLFIAGARLSLAGQKTAAAAQAAARAASLARTPAAGSAAAQAAAADALASSGQVCSHTTVQAQVAGLAVPVGQMSTVMVTVSCTVPIGDLVLVGGGPGVRTVQATFTSIVDAYRGRG
ncbi:pilus assembly protein [Streptomyces sp. SDr-06]|uniref:TadE/TadG family type IV pilus assembly protein n=1 Tax=Streptomyces sp. SDr-06 TaxID=2267702 RepID=UPI000DEAA7C1|nr:TadE/TadG family type IV pilus assembly protein [Streptomyces sp. SDr-06]RCH59643.1 pilus assembly protein [Streptomyces sp. SDr-06]